MATQHQNHTLDLPLHPTMRYPAQHSLAGQAVQALYIDRRGRARYPIMGGSQDPNPPLDPPAPTPPGPPSPTPPPPAEPEFPANTPVEKMTAPQREAYYKHQAQKWQGRAENSYGLLNDLGAKTPEEIAAIKNKVAKHDELEHELMSDKDKAVDQAQKDTRAAADAEYLPQLVTAKFEAVAAGRIDDERLAQILAPLDLTKFLTTDGKTVDTEKVKTYVDGVAPDKGTPRRGPSPDGQGHRTGSDAKGTAQERATARLERLGVKSQ